MSGSNATLDAVGAALHHTTKGPGSDSPPGGFHQLRDEYYIDFFESIKSDEKYGFVSPTSNDAVMVDLKFIDFIGTWQHFTIPVSEMNEEMMEEGRMFDGSSIRCWQTIDNSDMKVVPDLSTFKMDPFFEHQTLSVICDIQDPVTGEDYSRDPRNVTKKAEKYLYSTGIAILKNPLSFE